MKARTTAAIVLAATMILTALGAGSALAEGITKVQLGQTLLDAENPSAEGGASLNNGVLTLDNYTAPGDVLSIPEGEKGSLTIVLKGDSTLGGISSDSELVDILIIQQQAEEEEETEEKENTEETADDENDTEVKLPSLTIKKAAESTDGDETNGDDTNKDETNKDDTIKDDTSKDDTNKDDTNGDDTNKDDTNKDETNGDDTIKDDTNKDDTNGEGEQTEPPLAAIYINGSLTLQGVKVDMEEDSERLAGVLVKGDIMLREEATLAASSAIGPGISCKNLALPEGTSVEAKGSTGIITEQNTNILGSLKASGIVPAKEEEAGIEEAGDEEAADDPAYAYGIYSKCSININLAKGESLAAEGVVFAGETDEQGGALAAKDLIIIDKKTAITIPAKGKLREKGEEDEFDCTILTTEDKVADKVEMGNKLADKGLLIFSIQLADSIDRANLTDEQKAKLDAATEEAQKVSDDNDLTAFEQTQVDEAVGKLIEVIKEIEQQQATPTPSPLETATPTPAPLETATPTPSETPLATPTPVVATPTPKQKPYYANIKQWTVVDGRSRGLDDDGDEIVSNWGWDNSRSTWYYFDENGNMVTNQWVNTRNIRGILRWYHLSESGAMSRGWQKLGGEWYYLHDVNGHALTAWQKLGGTWYYMDERGIMQTGWIGYKDKWYFMGKDGAMYTGYWQAVDNSTSQVSWQYFDKNGSWEGEVEASWGYTTELNTWHFLVAGVPQTDWQWINGQWYYFDLSSIMRTGWLYNGKWYYLRANGAMATGWEKVGDKWYWLDSKNGDMAAGTTLTIAGKRHSFAADGTWQGTI